MYGLEYQPKLNAWWHAKSSKLLTRVNADVAKLLGVNFELFRLEVTAAYGPDAELKIEYLRFVKLEEFVGASKDYIIKAFRKAHNRAINTGKEKASNWSELEAKLFSKLARKLACPIAYIGNSLTSPTRVASEYAHNMLKAYLSDFEVLNRLARKLHLTTWQKFPECLQWLRGLGKMQLVRYDKRDEKFVHIGPTQRVTGNFCAEPVQPFEVKLYEESEPSEKVDLPQKLLPLVFKRFNEFGEMLGLRFDKSQLSNSKAHEVYQVLAHEFNLRDVAKATYDKSLAYLERATDAYLKLYLAEQEKRLKPRRS